MPKATPRARERPSGLSLAKFASAKATTYDKQAQKLKKQALNSKVVNKYRKLKSRLQNSNPAAAPLGNAQVPAHLNAILPRYQQQSFVSYLVAHFKQARVTNSQAVLVRAAVGTPRAPRRRTQRRQIETRNSCCVR